MVDPGTADEALGILRSGREQVRRENDRHELVMVGARAVSTVLWMARRDIRDPVLRRTCNVVLFLGSVGWALWMADRTKVQGMWTEQQQRFKAAAERVTQLQEEGAPEPQVKEQLRELVKSIRPETVRALALVVGLSVAERVVVRGFRRSGIRYPHLAAGVVMAAANTAVHVLRRRKRASDGG